MSNRVLFASLLLVPLLAFAQTQSAALREQIRADLKNDPRAAQLSQVELETMIEAIATKAEEDGVAEAYLESHDTFDYSSLFPEPKKPSALATFLASPLSLALFALLVVLVAVAYYIVRRRGTPDVPNEAL